MYWVQGADSAMVGTAVELWRVTQCQLEPRSTW